MKRTLLFLALFIDQNALLPLLELVVKPIGRAGHIRDEGPKAFVAPRGLTPATSNG